MLDNIWTMVILYTAMNLPLAVWMMRSFLLEVPREVLEAGEVDGAGLPTSIRKIILPIVSPGLAATALICFIFAWNEFFLAVNLTATNAGTAPIFLVGFISSEGLFLARALRRRDAGLAAGADRRLGGAEQAGPRPVDGSRQVKAAVVVTPGTIADRGACRTRRPARRRWWSSRPRSASAAPTCTSWTASSPRPIPIVPGHEFAGEIVAVGSGGHRVRGR